MQTNDSEIYFHETVLSAMRRKKTSEHVVLTPAGMPVTAWPPRVDMATSRPLVNVPTWESLARLAIVAEKAVKNG